MENVVKLINVSKSFSKKIIFNNVNLSIDNGNFVGIQGLNGSGKTILFKLICGIYRPTSGEIFVNNKKIGKDIDFPENIGLSMKDLEFEEYLTGYEILKNISSIRNIINENDIKSTIDLVGLNPDDKTIYKHFSLGMKQKLNLAQAIMENQSLIILDEPFNGVDNDTYCRFVNIIKNLRNENKTVLLTTHIRKDIYNLCDKIYNINNNIENIL